MRYHTILVLCTCLILASMTSVTAADAAPATTAKSEKETVLRIAVANMDRITSDIDYEKLRMLSIDKDTRDALRQINQELKQVRTELLALTDELKLMDYQKKLDFLNKKKTLIQERNYSRDSSRDVRKLARDFIVETYGGKYALILSEASSLERNAIHKAVVVEDITDEAGAKFRAHINELTGGE